MFKRSFLQMLTQTNDDFGTLLVDAVYRAEHGHPEAWAALLPEGVSLESFLKIVNAAEEESEPLWIGCLDAHAEQKGSLEEDLSPDAEYDEESNIMATRREH